MSRAAGDTDHGQLGDDPLSLALKAKGAKKDPRALPRLLLGAMQLVRRSAPRESKISAGLNLTIALLALAQVYAAKLVLGAVLKTQDDTISVSTLLILLAVLAVTTAGSTAATQLSTYQQRLIGEHVQQAVWSQLLTVTTRAPLESFEAPGFYDHLVRVQNNALSRPSQVATSLFQLLGGVVGAVALAVALLFIQPLLVPLLVLTALPTLYLARRGSRSEYRFSLRQATPYRLRVYTRTLLTERSAAKELRAFGSAGYLLDRHDRLYDTFLADTREQVRLRQRLALVSAAVTGLMTAATFGVLVALLLSDHISLAEAGAAAIAVRLLSSRLAATVTGVSGLFESALFLEDLNDFLTSNPVTATAPRPGQPLPEPKEVTVRNLTFRYPGADRDALTKVNLDIPHGAVVALVGENGSGKTTLAKIVAGLYEATDGSVQWGGHDLTTVDKADWRASVAVVFQDFVRYQFSAADNIALGRPERIDDEAAIRAAAQQARVLSALERLPHGLNTNLSKEFPGGVDLSGGQWQRVAAARAFFRDAPLVVLDEPSAALDPKAEHELFNDLRTLLAGRTVLFISHRFSTVRNADLIYVLADGEVIESGSHDELMDRQGSYAELFSLQAQAYL